MIISTYRWTTNGITIEALKGFLGIQGYWLKINGIRDIFVNILRDTDTWIIFGDMPNTMLSEFWG